MQISLQVFFKDSVDRFRAISRILTQLVFFAMPYFGHQEQCLGMKQPDNLHKRNTFVTLA